jgi:hypothetical protein
MVVRNVVDSNANVHVGIARLLDEATHIRKLIQTSSRTGSNLSFVGSRLPLLKAFLFHQSVNLIAIEVSQIQALNFFAMLIKEDQIRIVVRDEIDFQSPVRVSMSRRLDELSHLRKLVEASSGAALHLGCPSPLWANGPALGLELILSLGLQTLAEKLIQMLALPPHNVRTYHSVGVVMVF